MPDQPLATGDKAKFLPTLYLIVAWKLAKAVLLMITSFSIFWLAGQNLGGVFDQLLRWIHLDPEREFFVNIGLWLDEISPASFRLWGVGTFLYGLLMLAVGLGLAFRTRWAIWLAIGEYAFFIPIEISKMLPARSGGQTGQPTSQSLSHPHLDMLVMLAVNVAVVWYLFKNRNKLFRHSA